MCEIIAVKLDDSGFIDSNANLTGANILRGFEENTVGISCAVIYSAQCETRVKVDRITPIVWNE